MHKLFIILLIATSTLSSQHWQETVDFPSFKRDDGVVFVIDNIAYCGTDISPWWALFRDFYSLDMSTDLWASIASLPTGKERQSACSFSHKGKGYVLGGFNDSVFLNDVWEYHPLSDTWIEKSPLPAVGRGGSSCFVLDGTAYMIGGKTSSDSIMNDVWAYNIEDDSWQQKSNFPSGGSWRASAVALNEKGYLVFGINEHLSYSNRLYDYDPRLDSWSLLDPFPGAGRSYAGFVAIDNQLLIVAGLDFLGNSHNTMWSFNIDASVWKELDSIPSIGRREGLCFNNSEAVYYSTGLDDNDIKLKETWKNTNPTLRTDIKKSESKVLVFPNPSKGDLKFYFDSQLLNMKYILEVFDYQGRRVLEKELLSGEERITLSCLDNGIYLFRLVFENDIFELKWLKY
jgi:N-acetylneuraminic acid mutarotase